MALIGLGVYWAYQQPTLKPQLDQVWHNLLVLVDQTQNELNQQVGFQNTGNLGPQTVSVSVSKDKASDWMDVGKMGPAILGNSHPSLQIEIDYTTTSKPDSTYLNVITDVLSTYSGKNPQLSFGASDLPAKPSYSLQDIVNITKTYRTCFTSSTKVCLYVLFLPGKLGDSTALGAAYTSTSLVLFPSQFSSAAGPIGDKNRVATATITHELGHLFGLVGLISPSKKPHQDANHPGHSTNSNSVMYWAVEDSGLPGILGGGPPTQFDQDDIFDINQIKASQ